jgi:TolA-binding protein
MLMGKAYMYQGEYFLAAETFKHIMITFPREEIRFAAMTWLARSYIMVGETREAERILTTLTDESEFPDDYLVDLHTTLSQLHIAYLEYPRAAEQLELALERKGNHKEEKIRYTYILAQLYEESDQNKLALEKYKRVTRYNPTYEMAFNAQVSMAEVFESGQTDSGDLKKLLRKMLRDSKNTEYKDQIYFALGNIAMEEGEKELAIEYYQLSVSTSVQNQYQKGYSSLTLAEIYYEEPEYILSAAYYDSAVSFLDRNYPGYAGLATLSASLGDLVYNVTSYELEDSVQILAALPEEQRLAVIDALIEQVRQEEEEARLAEQQSMQDMAFNQSMLYGGNQSNTGMREQQGGKWYFYNLNAKSFGQPEFRMKWGERRLEDNWRRKNKQTISDRTQEGAEGDTLSGDKSTPLFDNKSREYYLINIPLNDSAMKQSHLRLEDALYNMGVIYKEDLLDYNESIQSFQELIYRYPDSRFGPHVYYLLYELNNNIQKPQEAKYYSDQLTDRYPESHYSLLLTNPNYLSELEEEEMKVVRYYEGIYLQYQLKKYAEVIAGADSAMLSYPDDPLLPKFKYIRAMAMGALVGKEEMKIALDSLISQHPASEESQAAQEIVAYMYVEFPEIKEAAQAAEAEVVYSSVDSTQEHYFLLALRSDEDANQVSFNLLNYNLDHFNQYNLELGELRLTDSYNLLFVSLFNNADGAARYLQVIQENSQEIMGEIDPVKYRMMIISTENFEILSNEKEFNPYYLYYLKHYQNQE